MAQSGALPDPNVVVSPSQRRSNCASAGVPDGNMPSLPMVAQDNQQCPRPFGNLTIKVVYESALPILQRQTSHGIKIPPSYSSVGVEQICDTKYEGLELDLLGGEGERILGDALHGIILWRKRYNIIPGQEVSFRPIDPPQPPSPQNSRPSSPAHPPPGLSSPPGPSHPVRSLSPAPSNPEGASDDDQNSLPRSPSAALGLKSGASKESAAPLKKSRPSRKKTKKSEPIKKLAGDMTPEELGDALQAYEMEPKPVDLAKLKFFIGMKKEVKKTLLSNYDRSLVKSYQKKKQGESLSRRTVFQLVQQDQQVDKDALAIAPLPLELQIQIIKFMEDTCLSLPEVLGQAEPPPPEKTVPKWPFELGKPLARPELVRKLSTKMYEFHLWYMDQLAKERVMFTLRVKTIDFFGEGEKLLWLEFKDIYEVYHQDALDVSLISAYVLMLIQRCRRESYFNIGVMDPALVNQHQIRDQPKDTLERIYKFLEQQNYKQYILLPYNFNFHWILLVIMIDQSNVIVLDSLRKPKYKYQDIQGMLNFAWKRFCMTRRGEFKEKLTFSTTFPVRNNLCGYYVYEHMYHFVRDKVILDNITESFLEIQEALMGFLVDEVINRKGEFYYGGHSIAEPSNTTMAGS
uniref:Ubiquitin-like protease family profile domain-containing protein n=1 Tax=Setaria viridis TaxID=4556 RepID=A0A4U6TIT1_SETVI|nr:hypothetical protein SEVIR_8G151800v2 [Setaria viridis]